MSPKTMILTGLGIETLGMLGGFYTGLPMNGFTLVTWLGMGLGLTGLYRWYCDGVDNL